MDESENEPDSDSRGQPTPILKYPVKSSKKAQKLPDFKLCFAKDLLLGHSDLTFGKPIQYRPTIPSRFYTKSKNNVEYDPKAVKENIDRLLTTKGPRELYSKPLVESHKYGWYPSLFIDKPSKVLHFGKDTSFMVQFRILEIAQDEKLQIKPVKKK